MNCLILCLFSMVADPVRETMTQGSVQATVEIDAGKVSLSGTLQVTLRIDGVAPLRVTLPKNLLHREVAQLWRIRTVGAAIKSTPSAGRERSEQRFELSPYLAGEAVPFRFAQLSILDGNSTEEKKLDFDKPITIRVETQVTDPDLKSLRPQTSIEQLPDSPNSDGRGSAETLFWVVFGIALALGLLLYWRPQRRREPELVAYSKAWTLLELDRLRQSSLPPAEWCERFAFLLRHFIERQMHIPATRLTSSELIQSLPNLPTELSDSLVERLRLSDQIRFTSAEANPALPFSPHDWISWSLQLVETLALDENLGDLHEVQKDRQPK